MDQDVKRIGDLRIAACGISFSDQIGLVVQKGYGAAHALIKNEAIDVLKFTMKSLNDERTNVIEWDSNRSDPMREQIYGLCEALELILKYKIISSTQESPCSDNKREVHEYEIEKDSGLANQTLFNDFESNHDLNFEAGQQKPPTEDATDTATDAIDNHLPVVPKLEDALFEEIVTPFIDQVKDELENSMIENNGNVNFLLEMEDVENAMELSTDDESDEEDTGNLFDSAKNIGKTLRTRKSQKTGRQDKLRKVKTHSKQNKRHHNSSGPYKCNECNIAYRQKRTLSEHIRIKHEGTVESRKQFHCDKCDSRFVRKDNFNRHQNLHSNDLRVRKPFACDICGARFAEKHHLKRHIRRH